VDVHAFVAAHLPAVPARVLVIGCGRGELARELADRGYEITAIDPDAPTGDIFRAVSLEDFVDPGPFDAVVASRALHHLHDLAGALAKVTCLLRPGGRFILVEHAWDRLDEPTARWYLERRRAIDPKAPRSLDACLADWNADHGDLHGYAGMRAELDLHFTERLLEWTPYLHGELGESVEEEERALIDKGAIQATGFRYVGETGI
jgi:SAM-dependent methyltransferase